jgi:acetoin utilization deacetylase AcuC-like enzyme
MISIHCHPDHDYPFHSGEEEETGLGAGEGTTLNLPLLPKTSWNEYKPALEKAVKRIQEFGATAMVVSMGLDTLEGDPCAVRRAGFKLSGNDYLEMGKTIGHNKIPTLFIQEGGYKMDKIAQAAADVLAGFAESQRHVEGNDL